jgi:hypothetical protein
MAREQAEAAAKKAVKRKKGQPEIVGEDLM